MTTQASAARKMIQLPTVIHREESPRATNPQQRVALALYDQGLNVIPMPYGQKIGYPWKAPQTTRLTREGLERIFTQQHNIAIMTGETSRNLFVLDCESMEVYATYKAALIEKGIRVVSVKTRRGAHIYLRCEHHAIANIAPGVLPDAELRGNREYVLAVGSFLTNGTTYGGLENWNTRALDIPTVAPSDIDFLRDAAGNRVKVRVKQRAPQRRQTLTAGTGLKPAARDYLQHGARLAEGERNTSLFAAACAFRDALYTVDQTTAELEPIATASGLPGHEAVATIRSAYRQQPKTRYLTHNLAAQFADDYTRWARKSDRVVFLALVQRCHDGRGHDGHGKRRLTFRATVRELATIARMSTRTVLSALHRMTQAAHYDPPLIRRDGTDGGGKYDATLWRFTDFVTEAGKRVAHDKSNTVCVTHTKMHSSSVLLLSRNTDALERGALGFTGMQVLNAMLGIGKPATTAEIAAAAGATVRQVHYALRTPRKGGLLRSSGTVTQAGRGLWQVNPAAADDSWLNHAIAAPAQRKRTRNGITQLTSVLGTGEQRKTLFRKQRAEHAQFVIERGIRRYKPPQDNTPAPEPKRAKKSRHTATSAALGQPLTAAVTSAAAIFTEFQRLAEDAP